jgi:hypothetical protein
MLYLTLVFHWRIHTENFDLIELEKLDVFQDSFNLEYPAPRLEQDALAPRFWKSLPLGRSDAWQGRTDWGRCWGGVPFLVCFGLQQGPRVLQGKHLNLRLSV